MRDLLKILACLAVLTAMIVILTIRRRRSGEEFWARACMVEQLGLAECLAGQYRNYGPHCNALDLPTCNGIYEP